MHQDFGGAGAFEDIAPCDGLQNAKASLASASSLLVDLLFQKNRRCPMRKPKYLRIRRVLKVTKDVLVIIVIFLTIVSMFKKL